MKFSKPSRGEGYFSGVPAIFVRLQGCPVRCSWCDTKHIWQQDEADQVAAGDIPLKTADSSRWASLTAEEIIALIILDCPPRGDNQRRALSS